MQLLIAVALFFFLIQCDIWLSQYLKQSNEIRNVPSPEEENRQEEEEEEELRIALAASMRTAEEENRLRTKEAEEASLED